MGEEFLILAMLIIAGLFLTIYSVDYSIRYFKIKNTLLCVLFFINAFLPISYIGFFILLSLLSQNNKVIALIIPATVVLVCLIDLFVIFILPILAHRKIAKDIENKILLSIWCLCLLVYFGISIFFLLIVFMLSGGAFW